MRENGSAQQTYADRLAKLAVRGSFLVFIGNTSSTLILAFASVIIARLLGPSDYGLYSVALGVPYLMVLFADCGVNSAIVRFASRFRSEGRSESIRGVIQVGMLFEFTMGLLVFSFSLLLSGIFATYVVNRPNMANLIQVGSPTIVGLVLFATSNSIFIGLGQMDKVCLLYVLSSTTKMVAAPLLIMLGFGVAGAITGHILGFLVAGAFGFLSALKICRYLRAELGTHSRFLFNLAPMIRYGMPLYVSNIIVGILGYYYTIVLPWFTSNTEIGNYSVAIIFSSILGLITIPISSSLFPAFSELNPSDVSDMKGFFVHALRYTMLLVMPASFFIALASQDLVLLFYGSNYTRAPLYLSIYSTTFLFGGFFLVVGNFFNGTGRSDMYLRGSLIQLFSTVSLSLVFTSLYGVIGFICATVMSALLANSYLAWVAHRKYEMEFDSIRIGKIFLAAFLSSVPTLFVSTLLPYSPMTKLILTGGFFSIIYLTVSPILGVVQNEDVSNLREVFKNMPVISRLLICVLSYEERILSIFTEKQMTDRYESC